MTAAVRHVQGLWGRWWFLPALPALYTALVWAVGDLRGEHIGVSLFSAVLGYASVRTKRFFVDVWPYVATAVGYDAVRYARQALLRPESVLGCELRDAELALFPVADGVTVQDYFAVNHLPALDLLFAVPYAIFAYVALVYAAFLYFADRPRMRHYLWAFAIGNFISFGMWLTIPAAPPWYIRDHGCLIDLAAAPSPAGLVRVDALLGITYFETFYSRASSVFGALPSMHCAYPLIGLLTAWRAATWRTLPIHIGYTVLMALAAIYLDHHWIIDALVGWVVAIISVVAAGYLLRLTQRRAAAVLPGRPQTELEPAE